MKSLPVNVLTGLPTDLSSCLKQSFVFNNNNKEDGAFSSKPLICDRYL